MSMALVLKVRPKSEMPIAFGFKVRTEIDSNGNQISQYDFTGGSVVALAKKRAREDEKNHEKEQLMMWRKNHQR